MNANEGGIACQARRLARGSALLFLFVAVCSGSPAARGQDGVSTFRKPVLIVETEGHHAPVRALLWPDSTTLISAGMDKVVKHWDLNDEPKLVRTIRPPVWRGPGGIIYATALSPWSLKDGTRLLAVAGYGVDGTRGDFTIYPYPGPAEPLAGSPIARLMPSRDPNALSQRNTVFTLAFNPKLQSLATAGASGIVTIWNTSTFQPIRALKGHVGGIRALAYLPDGRKLATIGEDKTLRLWDLDQGLEIARHQAEAILNALAVSPDGSAILTGTETGVIEQFDPIDIRVPKLRLPTRPEQGPVECLAFRHDGKQLLASVVTSKADMPVASDRNLACDIELRDFPGGKVIHWKRLPGLIYAASFRPDGKAFAFAGGPDQAILIQDVDAFDRPPTALKGKGTTVYDVGFSADSRSIGFARTADPQAAETVVDGFDLASRKTSRLSSATLRRAVTEYGGWTIRGSINQYRLEALQAGVVRWGFDLDPGVERLWWSYSFLPPGPGHPKPAVAIGTESGVVVYDLETGRRTRAFAGHSSPVVSLAPSPDGRWLASGSVDQTVMIDPLDGVDSRPEMGWSVAPNKSGRVVVGSVEARGFAGLMGLQAGDVIVEAMIAKGKEVRRTTDPSAILELIKEADGLAPQTSQLGIWIRRTQLFGPLSGFTATYPPFPSTKRNNPALSLMLDTEREWVAWTPQGYYETSIEGDTRLLGWHVNAPYDQAKPNDFLPIVTFQDTMRRPKVLDELFRLGDIERAIASALPPGPPPVAVAFDDRPPTLSIVPAIPLAKPLGAGQPWTLATPEARVKVAVSKTGDSALSGWEAFVDQKRLSRTEVKNGEPTTEELVVSLIPNRTIRLSISATNDRGVSRTESLDLIYIPAVPPRPEPRAPRLEVVALGTRTDKSAGLGAIPFADVDARDLSPFLADHLFPSLPKALPRGVADPLVVLNEGKATASRLRDELHRLIGKAEDKQLLPGDAIALAIVANGVESPDGLMLALPESSGPALFPASELSESLGRLTVDYGCRVALFVDLIHGDPNDPAEVGPKFKGWIRDLYQGRQVIVFVASKEGPSLDDAVEGRGLFASGLLGAFEQIGAASGVRDREADYSLLQFKTAVVERVLERSGRRQQAGCYIPRSVSQGVRFASPKFLPR